MADARGGSTGPRRRTQVLALASAILLGLLGAVLGATPAGSVAREPFVPGQSYTGDFPDPSLMRVGSTYYAYSTTTAALSLPVLTSTDLRSWVARPMSDPSVKWSQDGMSQPGPWVQQTTRRDGTTYSPTWAPSVVPVAGGFALAYSAPWSVTGQRCIGFAHSASPSGPFVDTTGSPVTCGPGGTAIDPQLFWDKGALYLLYKSQGPPPYLIVQPADAAANTLAPQYRVLLGPRKPWEGGVVENPAMVRYFGRLYLFYSANNWATPAYTTGYAQCRTVVGPCKRLGRLLPNTATLVGNGGASPVTDPAGRLYLAYAAFNADEAAQMLAATCTVSRVCPVRRLHTAAVFRAPHRRLQTVGLS